jgi:tripartite-type tricarboxylate transporter receptor subunit TctC
MTFDTEARPRPTRRAALFGLGGALIGPAAARAQAPAAMTAFVVPYMPGAPLEVVARALAQAMSARGHGSFVVDNRVGANGMVGARHAATARGPLPIWLFAADTVVTVNPVLQPPQSGFDPARDLRPVGAVAVTVNVLVVPTSSPSRTLGDFVARARQEEVMYSSGGIGAAGHLVMEQFARIAGLRTQHIPYRSGPQAANDLIAGRVQASFVIAGASVAAVRADTLRALAVSSATRLPALPEVPTLAESGFPGVEVVGVLFVMLPASASPDALAAAEAAVAEARDAPEFQAVLRQQGMLPTRMGPAESVAWMATEQRRWTQLITEAGIKADQ